MTVSRFSGIFGHLDLWTILLYAVIVVLGGRVDLLRVV